MFDPDLFTIYWVHASQRVPLTKQGYISLFLFLVT